MPSYQDLLKSDESKAYDLFYEKQKKHEKYLKVITYFSFIGGIILLGVIATVYSVAVSGLCAIVGFVCYVLGYHYSEAVLNKETNAVEFHQAVEEYEKDNPGKNQEKTAVRS